MRFSFHGFAPLLTQVSEIFDRFSSPRAALRERLAARAARRAEAALARAVPEAVAPAPETLEQRYALVDEVALADQAFERLRRRVFQLLDQAPRTATVIRETGRIAPGRPYFYLKPASGTGFLFERSGAGWIVAPAEKIVARDLFLRQGAPRERATLYATRDAAAGNAAPPRVRSPLFGNELTPFAVYEQKLLDRLGL